MVLPKVVIQAASTCLVLVLTACVGTSPPAQFYLLEPLTVAESIGSVVSDKPTLALAPVRIPHYLERAQLVTASGKNTYRLDELNRWAESLEDNITRVMLQELTSLVPADVVLTGSQRAKQAKLRLVVTILEFHIDPQGQAKLAAQWQVSRGEEVIVSKQSAFQIPASSHDAQVKVQGLNQCLNRLNQEMAAALVF
jgi:uncharacterized lipoprotein YmbA